VEKGSADEAMMMLMVMLLAMRTLTKSQFIGWLLPLAELSLLLTLLPVFSSSFAV
jgi:hypothetical protein